MLGNLLTCIFDYKIKVFVNLVWSIGKELVNKIYFTTMLISVSPSQGFWSPAPPTDRIDSLYQRAQCIRYVCCWTLQYFPIFDLFFFVTSIIMAAIFKRKELSKKYNPKFVARCIWPPKSSCNLHCLCPIPRAPLSLFLIRPWGHIALRILRISLGFFASRSFSPPQAKPPSNNITNIFYGNMFIFFNPTSFPAMIPTLIVSLGPFEIKFAPPIVPIPPV